MIYMNIFFCCCTCLGFLLIRQNNNGKNRVGERQKKRGPILTVIADI